MGGSDLRPDPGAAGARAVSADAGSGHPPGHPAGPAPAGRPPLLESDALLQGHRTVEIHHQGVYYRLQATRQGKLILTK